MSSVIVVKHGFRRAVIAAGLRGAPGTGGSGSAGVTKFNNRTGAVTLNGADVTTALGYTPANNASLAAVAFSGAYGALTGRPFIPAAPGDIGAASAAQGALADTAVQPAALGVLLDLKVDKIAGYGLSQENFTPAEKAKLAGLDGPLWKGTFTSLAALQSAHPTAEPGSSAHVDAGVGDPVKVYNWDASDGEWVAGGGDVAPVTAAQVKNLYESNPDTNAFTDSEKSKLSGVAAAATANTDTDSLPESATPTNKWFTTARVLATVLSGLSLATGSAVVDTDSVLAGFGKLQRQINDLTTALSGKQATLVSGTNIKTINGESLVGPGNLTVGGGAAAPGKNLVINGAFQVKQGAPAVTSGTVTLAAGEHGLITAVRGFDCWKGGASGCTYTFSTTGGVTSINITAGSLQQVLEGKNLRSGTHVLSWSGTSQGKIGAGSYAASGVTASVTGGTNLTIEFNTGTLSNVQLEEGSTATPFSTRLFATELALCKRYHPIFLAVGTGGQYIATAFAATSSQVSVAYQFDVEPRTAPTGVIVSAASHFNVNAGGGGAGPATSVVFNSASRKAARLVATAPGAITAGGGAEFFADGTDGAYLYFTGCQL